MNAKTRILPALLLAAALLPASVRAATSGPYTYTVADNKATITEFDTTYSGAVSITNELGGCPVTSIGDSAFYDCKSLTSVTIPASVTSIGESAFYNCYSLTSATIGNSVTDIGSYAFYFCESLTSITIPDSVTSIGNSAFYVCNSLTSATIGNSVESIGDGAFYNTPLASVTIGNSVTSIGVNAFRLCPLTTVTIPASVTSIGDSAFNGCASLTNVYIQGNAPSIGLNPFGGTPATIYYFPNTVGWSDTFAGRPALLLALYYDNCGDHLVVTNIYSSFIGHLTIPSSFYGLPVTSIGNSAFNGCTNLTSVTITTNVTNIGDAAFRDCTALTCVYIQGDAPSYGSTSFENTPATIYYFPDTDGWSNPFAGRPAQLLPLEFANGGDRIVITHLGTDFVGHLPIPASLDGLPVTSIGNSAFNGCTNLTSVTIPASVTSIGNNAFSSPSITAINVAENNPNYTSIDGVLFNKDLTTLIQRPPTFSGHYTITNSVTSIGEYAFAGCNKITSVTIPASVTSIGDYAFYNCTSITAINVSENNPNYTSIDGVLFEKGVTDLIQCPAAFSGGFTIPASVTNICDAAFRDCTALTCVYVQGNAPSYGSTSFENTPATVYYFPDTDGWSNPFAGRPARLLPLEFANGGDHIVITRLGSAFAGNLPIPASLDRLPVTSIGPSAFNWCKSLTSVTIPASVTSIGDSAFSYCFALTAVTIPGSVTSIGSYAFSFCMSLASVTIPGSVTSIGDSAFSSPSITAINVSENNPNYASFDGALFNKDLTTLLQCPPAFSGHYTITNSVTSIGEHAFSGCNNLTAVTIPGSVTSIGDSAFSSPSITAINVSENNPNYASFDGSLFNKDLTTLLQCPSAFSGHYTITNSVTCIGDGAFAGCWSLSSVSLPGGVTNIGASAFANCYMLSSVVIPDTVDSIGDQAFEYCYTLASILFTGNVPSSLSATAFDGISPTIYYLPGATGWDAPVNFQFPVCWAPPAVSTAYSPRFTFGAFAFTLVGNANLPVRIEACDSLASPSWSTVTDTTLDASGTLDFSDPDASSHASRFYRVSFPK